MKTWEEIGIHIPPGAPGPEVYSTCPQCSAGRKKKNVKCLSANIEKEVWSCAHCGFSGTLKTGADNKGDYKHWQRPTYRKPVYEKSDLPEKVVGWFASRGISEATLLRNKIGYEKVYMPQVEDFTTAIRFPYYRGDEVVNIKSRDGNKNFRMETGAERILYGLNDIGAMTIIVEGEIDKLSFDEIGYVNCISVPDGAPSPKAKDYSSKFEFLENCEDELTTVKTFILAVDSDEPGQVLQEELARRLGKERCKTVKWPEGCKDANAVLVELGKESLQKVIEDATPFPVEGLFEINDLRQQIMDLYHNGTQKGLEPGWKNINELYSVRQGEWTLVTGIPGHGKSEWLDALLVNLMWSNWRFAIFSPENQPLQLHVAKIFEKAIGMPFSRGPSKRMSEEEVQEGMRMMNNIFTFILPPEDKLTIDGILELAKAAIFRKGIKGLVLDPWNECCHKRPPGLTETEYISESLSKIRRFARTHGLHIWLVVHPTKLAKGQDGNYPVPTPYDCQGSAHWRNKADNCITIYRDMKTNNVEVHVQKIRFKEVGQVGMAKLSYDRTTGRYSDAES